MSAAVPVSEASAPKRVSITLDPGLVLERLILRRLDDLKRKRGQDWLRSLLVQGFLAEGHWLRTGAPDGAEGCESYARTIPATPFAHWLERSHANDWTHREPRPRSAESTTAAPDASTKAFAHLRKVIG